MSVNDPGEPVVAALQLKPGAIVEDLARWCGGVAVTVDGRRCIRLAATGGSDLARPGDWLVRLGEDEFTVMSPEEFAVRMEPLPDGDPAQ